MANAQDGDGGQDEEDRLLMSKESTDKYKDFDDLEDEDDFNDYDKDNVDHQKPQFNSCDKIEEPALKDDQQISKNVNTEVNQESKGDEPDTAN